MYSYARAEFYRLKKKKSLTIGLGIIILIYFLVMLFFAVKLEDSIGAPSLQLSEYREHGLHIIFPGPIFVYPLILQAVYMDDIYHRTVYRTFGEGVSRLAYVLVKFFAMIVLSFLYYLLMAAAYMLPLFYMAGGTAAPLSFYLRESGIITKAAFIRMCSLWQSVSAAAVFAFGSKQRMLPYVTGFLFIYYLPYLFISVAVMALPVRAAERIAQMRGFFVTQARFLDFKEHFVSRTFMLQLIFMLLLSLVLQYWLLSRKESVFKEEKIK